MSDELDRTGIYISDLGNRPKEDNILVTILGRGIPLHLVSSNVREPVLKIDLERAWNELGFESTWSNAVPVEILIR